MRRAMVLDIKKALRDFVKGKPVLVHDSKDRENEVDIFVRAKYVDPNILKMMRKDGGGLICVAIHSKITDAIGLPFIQEVYLKSNNELLKKLAMKDVPYDKRSSFSITVNHINTITGITDIDRAKTISELGTLCERFWNNEINKQEVRDLFIRNFRSPGHVHLLRGANKLLKERRGHTELAIALAMMAKVEPCVALVEMLGDNGRALSLEEAKEFANKQNLTILTGDEIIKHFLNSP
jgi:3,4-dihydroxy 2-butanone 4-phosphate synthase